MSTQSTSSMEALPRALLFLFIFALSVAAAAIFAYFLQFGVHLHRPLATETSAWGEFGDYLGGVLNPIIALGALLLLATSVKIQNDTLREARTQLGLQRTELAAQADSVQQQVFEATFFRLLETLRRLVENLEIAPGSTRGIGATFLWAIQLRDRDRKRFVAEQFTPDDAAQIFSQWYPSYRHQLAPYFEIVLMTLEFVERSNRTDRIFYTDILRATFSPGELFLLFHYGVGEGGNARFKILAEKYGLMDGFDPTNFDLPGGRRLWYAASRIPRNYTVTLT